MPYTNRPHLQRWLVALVLGVLGSLAILSTLSLVAGEATDDASQVRFSRAARLMLFVPAQGQWVLSSFAHTKPGNEIYVNNRLYRVSGPNHARLVLIATADKLLNADRPYQGTSRRPVSGDVVQVLGSEGLFAAHAFLEEVRPDATVRYLGVAYSLKADRSLVSTGAVFASAAGPVQPIDITRNGLQHVLDRHTPGGSMTMGRSVFLPGEDVQALIRNAEIAAPILEGNGYLRRDMDAGRHIGVDGRRTMNTSTYRVITTQSGKLVTAYPIIARESDLHGY